MPNNKGFTLIELIIVIVLLGVLAATAAPKFINLTGAARTATMKGLQGRINSAIDIAHAKALISGDHTEIQVDSNFYALLAGWPTAAAAGDGSGTTGNGLGIQSLLKIEWETSDYSYDDQTGIFSITGAQNPATCIITYTESNAVEDRPNVTPDLIGC
ncbi:prepilin-type N-terminal cleavage/methylation domain-containing protein [Thalassotalea sp. ND16A]|uniref:prepilin-type N-terminal cleavage/methylation domain-containing protein n=1 Tax=Thalassotalea sp. ND16A TaxID=1535422 RepID=UPI00051D1933|nr:type II secretion system protein [Thalassotalea sp. ND16A]KGJ98942.1 hypothetical protein ND16A_0464 [Thalassotalea sp. ND16A]